MVKKHWFVLLTLFFATTLFSSAKGVVTSASNFFVVMPQSEIPYLDMSLKQEMVELYQIKSPMGVKNMFGGRSWISYMDSTRVDVVLSKDMCLLTVCEYEGKRGKKIYAVIKTLFTPIADSRLSFYDDDLQPLDVDRYINVPEFKDFFSKQAKKSVGEVVDKISMLFLKIDIAKDGTMGFTMDDMWLDVLDTDVVAKLRQSMQDGAITYKWNQNRFKRVEN